MRLIPVMDLRGGLVVHAVKGERERYQPVKSVLADSAEPLAVARAFRDRLGLRELYIADLDAIGTVGGEEGHGMPCPHWEVSSEHRALISALAHQEGMKLLVDAGASDVESALEVLGMGAGQVIIGAETLATWEALLAIPATIPTGRLIFSLDMRTGRVLSRSPQLAALSPLEALSEVYRAGWQEVILLDLARVGTGAGVDRALIAEARHRFPELSLLAGGGIRNVNELGDLKAIGVTGALVSTVLHQGGITIHDIETLA